MTTINWNKLLEDVELDPTRPGGNPPISQPEQPPFGQYVPNMIFDADQDSTGTAWDVPAAPRESLREALKELYHTPEFIFFLSALALFLVVMWVQPWFWGR
jgi:hypothetical protein